jgi:hypothetical protein
MTKGQQKLNAAIAAERSARGPGAQSRIAKRAGVSRPALCRWASGQRSPGRTEAVKLSVEGIAVGDWDVQVPEPSPASTEAA